MRKKLFRENNTCAELKNVWRNSVSEDDALADDCAI